MSYELIFIDPNTRNLEINRESYFLLDPVVQECFRQKYNKGWEKDVPGVKRLKVLAFLTYCTLMFSPRSPYAGEKEEVRDTSSRAAFGSIGDWDFTQERVYLEAYNRLQELFRLDPAYRSWQMSRDMYESSMAKIESMVREGHLMPDEADKYMGILDSLPDRLKKLRDKAVSSLEKGGHRGTREINKREDPGYIQKYGSKIESLQIGGNYNK